MNNPETYPPCFGVLNKVFPMGSDGLRSTPSECLSCIHKVNCLKKAAGGEEGKALREESIDRAYESGLITFFERWSQKKYLKKRTKKNNRI